MPCIHCQILDVYQLLHCYPIYYNHSNDPCSCSVTPNPWNSIEFLAVAYAIAASEGVETATYTDNQSEGWIDPFMFHSALKSKAIELGADIKSRAEIISCNRSIRSRRKNSFRISRW